MHIDYPFINIRPETEHDRAFLEALYRSTRNDLLQLGLPEAMLNNLMQMQFNAQLSSYRSNFPAAEYAIIEKDCTPIGYLVTHCGEKMHRVIYIAFLPHERNKGYGRGLLKTLQAVAAQAAKGLALSVDPQNAIARHLYLSMGFQVSSDDGVVQNMVWSDES